MVLSFDFDGFNGKQYLDGYLLFVFLVATLKHVRVSATTNFV